MDSSTGPLVHLASDGSMTRCGIRRPAGGHRVGTRTRAVADPEVAAVRDESDYPGRCGVSVNRCHTADGAEFRRRLLSGNVPCDGRANFVDNVRTGDIGDDAQATAAVRADRQIDREYSAQSLHPAHRRSRCRRRSRCSRCSRVVLTISTSVHLSVCTHTQAFQCQGRSDDVATQSLDPLTLVWRASNRRVQRESVSRHREWLWHTRSGCRCGELERQQLTPSVWADGNAVLH